MHSWNVKRFLGPELGWAPVEKLQVRAFDKLYRSMSDSGYSPSTVAKCHATASGALRLAERNGWVVVNAARLAEKPRQQLPDIRIPTAQETERFLGIAGRMDGLVHDYARVMAASGLRPGEACGLMADDLDRADTLTVQRAVDVTEGYARIKSTKTRRIRRVTLDSDTADLLRRRDMGPYIFGAQEPARTDLLSKKFKRVAVYADMPWLLPRLFRHFHATQLLAANRMSLKQIADRLGHADVTMLVTRYGRSLPALDAIAADVMGDLLPKVTT
jgi:integrase